MAGQSSKLDPDTLAKARAAELDKGLVDFPDCVASVRAAALDLADVPAIDGTAEPGRPSLAVHAHQERPVRELQWLTASEIGAAYAARRLSPVELVRALLREIEAHNSDCGAFIRVDAEGALETARRAEADIFAGRSLGPLHGIPLGAKDNIDIAGGPTTCHSKILLDNVARADAPAIANLRAAGAIMLGKRRCTNSRSAARPRNCRSRLRAIRGIPTITPADRRRAPAWPWPPVLYRCRSAPTPAARSATRRAIAAWSD